MLLKMISHENEGSWDHGGIVQKRLISRKLTVFLQGVFLWFYQKLFLIISQQMSKTLMASSTPPLAFSSVSSTPKGPSVSLWIT